MTLLEECIEVLGENVIVFSKEESEDIHSQFQKKFEFTFWGRIDWEIYFNKKKAIQVNEAIPFLTNYYPNLDLNPYILWDEASLPIIKSDLVSILQAIDDVTAVSFDTWIYSPLNNYVIEFYHEGGITIGTDLFPSVGLQTCTPTKT